MQSTSEIIFTDARELATRTPRRDELMSEWLLSKRSANTRAAYATDLRAFFAWVDEFGAQMDLSDVFATQRRHGDFYRTFLTNDYAPASVARRLTVVSSFFTYVCDETNLMESNPMARVTRPVVSDESTTASLALDEARRLLAAAREAGAMEHALIGLLLTTGLRISEVINADTTDLSRERGHCVVSVVRKGGKRAKLPVPAEVAEALSVHLDGRKGPLFVGGRDGRRLYRQAADRILVQLAARAGVPPVTPHGLRHSAATIALDGGRSLRDVQQMLGHRDPKTTVRYDRSRTDIDQSAVHTVAELLQGAK